MKKKITFRLISFIIFLLGISIFAVVHYLNFIAKYNNLGTLPSKYVLSKQDSELVSSSYWNQLKVDEVYQSKIRGPISRLIFDGKFYLVIHKMNLHAINRFKDFFYVENKSASETNGVTYRVMGNPSFYFTWKGGLLNPASKIYFGVDGDSLRTVTQNDSILSYHLFCKNFSLCYSKDEPIDFFFQGKGNAEGLNSEPVSLDILFLKRNQELYLLFMTPINPNSSIDPQFLNNIVSEK